EQGQQERLPRDQLLGLPIDRVPYPGIRLAPASLGEIVQLRASEVASEKAGLGVEERVHEVVRVRVVRVPAPDVQVSPAGLRVLDVLRHGLVDDANLEADLTERGRELAEERRELAEEDGMDRRGQLDRLPRDRRLDGAVGSRGARDEAAG